TTPVKAVVAVVKEMVPSERDPVPTSTNTWLELMVPPAKVTSLVPTPPAMVREPLRLRVASKGRVWPLTDVGGSSPRKNQRPLDRVNTRVRPDSDTVRFSPASSTMFRTP